MKYTNSNTVIVLNRDYPINLNIYLNSYIHLVIDLNRIPEIRKVTITNLKWFMSGVKYIDTNLVFLDG